MKYTFSEENRAISNTAMFITSWPLIVKHHPYYCGSVSSWRTGSVWCSVHYASHVSAPSRFTSSEENVHLTEMGVLEFERGIFFFFTEYLFTFINAKLKPIN